MNEHTYWKRIQDVIRDAEAVKILTESTIRDIVRKDAPSGHATAWERATADLFNVFCGKIYCGEWKGDPQIKNELLWDCISLIVTDQFEDLTVRDMEKAKNIYSKTMGTHSDFRQFNSDFWIADSNDDHQQAGREHVARRRYLILSVFSALRNNLPKGAAEEAGDELEALNRLVRPRLSDMVKESIRFGSITFERESSRESLQMYAYSLLHTFELAKLAEMLGLRGPLGARHKDEIFTHLEKLLTRGSDRAHALEVSLLLRILGGRFLNNGKPRCEPRWRTTFSEAIRYISSKQNQDGQWTDHRHITDQLLLHGYSPLIYVLDIGLDVLGVHLEDLTKSANLALFNIHRTLEELALEATDGRKLSALADQLIVALSLTSIVLDRFKDLLSNSILENMGARVPQSDRDWNSVPDALGLKHSLDRGVIQPWKDREPTRPGALLIYGPPGTGKTTIAKLLAQQLNGLRKRKNSDNEWRFLELSPADFARRGSDQIVACAEQLFSQLRQVRRCVVLLDEMEEFLRTRDFESDKESRLITTAFLPLLQDTVRDREIILVVATNFVGNIDPAVTRRGRFDLILPLGPPNGNSRRTIISGVLDKYGLPFEGDQDFEDWYLEKLTEYTMGYSYSEITDFLLELRRRLQGQPGLMSSRRSFVVELWRIRCERVPTALSGRAGCNWNTFADEARRFARYPDHPPHEDLSYWKEPDLPVIS